MMKPSLFWVLFWLSFLLFLAESQRIPAECTPACAAFVTPITILNAVECVCITTDSLSSCSSCFAILNPSFASSLASIWSECQAALTPPTGLFPQAPPPPITCPSAPALTSLDIPVIQVNPTLNITSTSSITVTDTTTSATSTTDSIDKSSSTTESPTKAPTSTDIDQTSSSSSNSESQSVTTNTYLSIETRTPTSSSLGGTLQISQTGPVSASSRSAIPQRNSAKDIIEFMVLVGLMSVIMVLM